MSTNAERREAFAYVSSWRMATQATSYAFDICRTDLDSGELSTVGRVHTPLSVGSACVDGSRDVLYCTDEVATNPEYFDGLFDGQERYRAGGGGRVYAYRIDRATGELDEINHLPSYGSLPCSVARIPQSDLLVVTNHTTHVPVTRVAWDGEKARVFLTYDDATTVLYSLDERGGIEAVRDVFVHEGEPGPLDKQNHSQPHAVVPAPSGDFVIVCDKGADELVTLAVDRRSMKLTEVQRTRTTPGSSPRTALFHPDRPWLFVNYETKAIVESFRYDSDGRLTHLGSVAALPPGAEDGLGIWQSTMQLHPDGRHLYALARGLDAVSVFAIDDVGQLKRIQSLVLDSGAEGGGTTPDRPFPSGPRGGAISPDGALLYVACPEADKVIVCAIGADGTLTKTGRTSRHLRAGSVTLTPMVGSET